MFDTNELLARLQNGESADAIAQEMASALNDAIAEHQKEEAAKNNKTADARALTLNIIAYIGEYHPKLYDMMFEDQSKEAMDANVESLTDGVMKTCEELETAMPMITKMAAFSKSITNHAKSADDILNDWLKTIM